MRKIHILGFVLLALTVVAMPSTSSAQISVGIAVHLGPPALPVYEQPLCPAAGYLWTPGYWAYGADGYYWVPGTWAQPPEVGLLWTPGYWGWGSGGYFWHTGYWGAHVGFYGGINYGFGYGGVGFVGGRWDHGVFAYNTAVMRVDTRVIHTTYVDRTVVRNVSVNRVSFNGGRGGVEARPTHEELAVEHEHHFARTAVQTEHQHSASTNRELRSSVNHGRPAVAATARPSEFSGHANAGAESGRTDRPPNAANEHRNAAAESHGNDRPASRAGSSESKAPRAQEESHAAKSTAHKQDKPQKENKNKPKKEEKPHRD